MNEVDKTLKWVDSIRESEIFGHSPNELRMILLADEVLRLRHELKAARQAKTTKR